MNNQLPPDNVIKMPNMAVRYWLYLTDANGSLIVSIDTDGNIKYIADYDARLKAAADYSGMNADQNTQGLLMAVKALLDEIKLIRSLADQVIEEVGTPHETFKSSTFDASRIILPPGA